MTSRLYMFYMLLVAKEKGYEPSNLARFADHNEWLAFCYEIHDATIPRWREKVVKNPKDVPEWSTYRFRQLCLEAGQY